MAGTPRKTKQILDNAWVAELVDARDLKSLSPSGSESSILSPGTNNNREVATFFHSLRCSYGISNDNKFENYKNGTKIPF